MFQSTKIRNRAENEFRSREAFKDSVERQRAFSFVVTAWQGFPFARGSRVCLRHCIACLGIPPSPFQPNQLEVVSLTPSTPVSLDDAHGLLFITDGGKPLEQVRQKGTGFPQSR